MPIILVEIPLLALLAPIVLYLLAKTEAVWFRPFVNDLASILRKVWIVGGTIADSIITMEGNLRANLGAQVLYAEQPAVRWLYAARTFITQLFYTATNAAIESGRAIEQLAHLIEHEVAVPTKVTVRKVTRTVYRLDKKTAAAIAAAYASIAAVKHAATVTVPHGIAGEIADLRGYVNRRADQLAKRIRSLEKPALAGLTLGIVYAALRRLGLGWLKCERVGKTGKALCGMDQGLLDALLAGSALVVGSISIVEFAKELQAIEGEVVAGLRGFVREI